MPFALAEGYICSADSFDSTLEDIDRFFETSPGVLIHRNKLAVQLHRPAEFIEADERIARADTETKGKPDSAKSELVVTKEAV